MVIGTIALAVLAAVTAGWENVCAGRGDFPVTKVLWRADLSRKKDFSVFLRDGAKGFVDVGRDGIHVVKSNACGTIIVKARPFATSKGRRIRFCADTVVRDSDVDYSNASLRYCGSLEKLSLDWKEESENFWSGGQQTMRGMPCTAPGMAYRKFAQCRAEENLITPMIVVSGAPSDGVWRNWLAEDVEAAQAAWKPYWDSKCSTDHSGDRMDEGAFDGMIAADRPHMAKIARIDGTSRLLVDGEIAAPAVYRCKEVYDGSSRDGGDTFAGKPLDGSAVQLMVKEIRFGAVPGARGYWTKDGFDVKGAVREIKDAMRLAPKSLFILALGCTAYREFTVREHPEEVWRRKDGTPVLGDEGSCIVGYKCMGSDLSDEGPWPWVSPSSRLWRDAIRRCIRELMAELRVQGLDKRIVGTHLWGYHDAQFSIPYDDHSPCAKAEYARMIAEPGCLSTNYTFCLKQAAFRAQEEFAREFKQGLGKDAIAVMWCESPFMGAINASVDVTSFARSDAIDVIVCQSNYRERLPGYPTVSTIPTDSLHLHGKMFWNEFDLRTYAALETWANSWPSMKSLGHSEDFPMWQSVYRKLAGEADALRMGYWFYDMGGGWYEAPEIATDIRSLAAEQRDLARRPRSDWRPDVATVLDEVNIIRGEGTSHPPTDDYIYHHQCRYFGTSGVPYERYLAEDVLDDPSILKGKKMVVLAFFREIDGRRRELLHRLAARGTTLVFLSETGVCGGSEEIRFEPELKPGDHVHRVVAEPGVVDNVTSEMDTVALRDCGVSTRSGPRCTVRETAGVRVLARYADDGTPAIAERLDADCRRVYICEPGGLTPGLMNRLAREAGAFVAVDRPGLQVDMNGDFVSVHCLRPGTYDLTLPFDCEVVNLKSGKIEPTDGRRLRLELSAGETCRFGIWTSRTDRIRAKLRSGDRDYVFVAMHRGDWRHYPENSRGAITGCIEAGADIVELDVARTKDGRFILNHDNSLDRTTTGKGLVSDHTLAEIKSLRLRDSSGGKDAVPTDYEVLTLEEALGIAKGRILVNIDHFDKYPQEILDAVERCGALKGVLIKAVYGRGQAERLLGGKYWNKVMSGELLFMPIIRFCWDEHKTSLPNFEEWLRHEPRIGSMYEMCFDTDRWEAQLGLLLNVPGSPRIWVNTMWDALSNHRPDSRAVSDPDAVWGWCVRSGVTMIQTDCGQEALAYLKSIGRRDL